MSELNILSSTTTNYKTLGLALPSTVGDVLVVAANKVAKVNTILVSNVSVSNGALTLVFYDSSASTSYYLAKGVVILPNSTLDVLNTPLFLEENDKIRAYAASTSSLETVVSYDLYA
jgi:hypothetical protein